MSLFNSHNKDNIEIRPRFKLLSDLEENIILNRLSIALPLQSEVKGHVDGDHCFFFIPKQQQHYWSPVMEVVIKKDYEDESKTCIRCLIGPRQSIWLMLMFGYVGISVLALFGGLYGLVKWDLGKESIFIWTIPVGLVLFALIYFTSKYGQRKGRDQMLYLVSFLYHAIDDNEIVRL
jgi:hypothetical protein